IITLPAGSSAAQPTRLIGYNTSRTDYGTRPTFQAQGAFGGSVTILTCGNNTEIANVIVDAASKTSTRCGNRSGTVTIYYRCNAYNNGRHGFNWTAAAFPITAINCVATNHTAGGAYGFTGSAASGLIQLFTCAGFNNTANVNTTAIPTSQQFGFIALTAQPF